MNEVNNSFGVGKEDEVEAWGEDWDGTEGMPGKGALGQGVKRGWAGALRRGRWVSWWGRECAPWRR